jgi:hypothetical protein
MVSELRSEGRVTGRVEYNIVGLDDTEKIRVECTAYPLFRKPIHVAKSILQGLKLLTQFLRPETPEKSESGLLFNTAKFYTNRSLSSLCTPFIRIHMKIAVIYE